MSENLKLEYIECWYQSGCNVYQPNCYKTCHRYLEMHYLISNCGMKNASKYIKPIIPENCDIDAYTSLQEIKDNIVPFVEQGRDLYIASKNFGNGKTTWALKLMYKYFDEIWCGNGFTVRGYFIHVPTFLNKLRTFSYRQTEEYHLLDNVLTNCDLVIWDDISAMELNPNEQNNLLIYIDQRNLKDKSNIYTGNLLNGDLEKAVGSKLSNRIWENSTIVELRGIRRINDNSSTGS